MAVHGLDPWDRLKILVSAVQSRPCPPSLPLLSDARFLTVTEMSPKLSLKRGHLARKGPSLEGSSICTTLGSAWGECSAGFTWPRVPSVSLS
jgi:hypothetical protein